MNRDRTRQPRGRELARALGLPKFEVPPQSKTCRKRAYRSYDEALTAGIRRRTPYPLRVYECVDCAAFHLTHRV